MTDTMYTLAHLSDPHLAPLPMPSWSELIGKRVTGYINWQKKRRFIHDPDTLAAIVADLKAQTPDHVAVTGDIANIGLAAEFPQGRDWLEHLGSSQDVTFVPGNTFRFITRPLVCAGTTSIASGTSCPSPRLVTRNSPCLTVSMIIVARSTVGAAGLSLASTMLTPLMAPAVRIT